MARDYRRTSKRYQKRSRGFGTQVAWVIIGILVGLTIAAILYFKYQPGLEKKPYLATRAHAAHKKVTVRDQSATQSIKKNSTQRPEFDFYTVLPKAQENAIYPQAAQNTKTPTTQVSPPPLPDSPIAPASPLPSTEALPASPSTLENDDVPSPQHYILQIAVLKNRGGADRLKAELSMLGFEVHIQKFHMKNEVWNRIVIGPYTSQNAALTEQKRLKRNNIKSVLVKQP